MITRVHTWIKPQRTYMVLLKTRSHWLGSPSSTYISQAKTGKQGPHCDTTWSLSCQGSSFSPKKLVQSLVSEGLPERPSVPYSFACL